jgi:hypothetical protein
LDVLRVQLAGEETSVGKTRGLAIALAGIILLTQAGAQADAISPYPFVFETARTTATSTCADPCYQLRIFVEDHAHSVSLMGIQMEMDVMSGATVAELPVYPETNTNASGGSATFLHPAVPLEIDFPWSFTAVARSPREETDALLLNHNIGSGLGWVSVESVAQMLGAYEDSCQPPEQCAILANAVILDRIYLGRFNVTRASDPLAAGLEVRVEGISVVGTAIAEQVLGQANGRIAFVPYPVSEPHIEHAPRSDARSSWSAASACWVRSRRPHSVSGYGRPAQSRSRHPLSAVEKGARG